MYYGYEAQKFIHEERVRELLNDALYEENYRPGRVARLRVWLSEILRAKPRQQPPAAFHALSEVKTLPEC